MARATETTAQAVEETAAAPDETASPEHPGLGRKDFTIPGVGVFRMKAPDNMLRLQIKVRQGALQGPEDTAPIEAQNMAYVRAAIDVCCESYPADFDWASQWDWAPFTDMVVAWAQWGDDFRHKLAGAKARRGA